MPGFISISLLTTLLTGATMFTFSDEAKQALDKSLLNKADKIELVRIKGKLSYIEYKRNEPDLAPYAPPISGHTVTPITTRPFGAGAGINGRFVNKKEGHCGLLVDLSRRERLLNILPFDTLTIEGAFSGKWEVALADQAHYLAADNVPMGVLADGKRGDFDLPPFTRLDLRRAKYLVFILKSEEGSIDLKKITFTRRNRPEATEVNGIWLWDTRRVIGHETRVISDLAARGLKRVYMQVGDDLELFVPFLRLTKAAGIEVFALDGSPDYVTRPAPLLKRVKAVAAFNRNHAAAPFAGFQIDVEAYTKRDYNLRRDYYSDQYLALLSAIRTISGGDLKLSAVIPFWYDTVPSGKTDLARQTIAIADEVVVMSYRTGYDGIMEIAADELAYGEKMGKAVYLGLEITPLDDEEHAVLVRGKPARKGNSAGWQESGEYQVKGSDLSFFGRMADLPAVMAKRPAFTSFSGWVIHSYEGLERQQE